MAVNIDENEVCYFRNSWILFHFFINKPFPVIITLFLNLVHVYLLPFSKVCNGYKKKRDESLLVGPETRSIRMVIWEG